MKLMQKLALLGYSHRKEMNSALKHLKRSDFKQTFESAGTSFLFEDLVTRYYMIGAGESIKVTHKIQQVFIASASLERMKVEGLSRTADQTKQQIAVLDSALDAAVAAALLLKDKEMLDIYDVETFFTTLSSGFSKYLYFDPSYWDGVFEKSKVNGTAAENVHLVQDYKNSVRSKFEPLCFTSDSYMSTLLAKLENRFKVSVAELEWYGEADIRGLFKGVTLTMEDISARKLASVYYVSLSAEIIFVAGEEASQFINDFDIEAVKLESQLMGRVANSTGTKIQGRVRIIRRDYGDAEGTRKQMDAMNQGEILVSDTTDPELIPAFQKASAVITDMGGLLSHAAITSREMGLPCIVGVAEASKILKTGDLIEVDTEKGEVRILSQA